MAARKPRPKKPKRKASVDRISVGLGKLVDEQAKKVETVNHAHNSDGTHDFQFFSLSKDRATLLDFEISTQKIPDTHRGSLWIQVGIYREFRSEKAAEKYSTTNRNISIGTTTTFISWTTPVVWRKRGASFELVRKWLSGDEDTGEKALRGHAGWSVRVWWEPSAEDEYPWHFKETDTL